MYEFTLSSERLSVELAIDSAKLVEQLKVLLPLENPKNDSRYLVRLKLKPEHPAGHWREDNQTRYTIYYPHHHFKLEYLLYPLEATMARFALFENLFFLHASGTVTDKGQAVLFSAASGTGKSTIIKSAPGMIADDTVVLKPERTEVWAYPSPFERRKTGRHSYRLKVKRIYFLVRGKKWQKNKLSPAESWELLFANHLLNPFGIKKHPGKESAETSDLKHKSLIVSQAITKLASRIAALCPCYRLTVPLAAPDWRKLL